MASHHFEVIEKSHATSVSEIYEAVNPQQGTRYLIEVLGQSGFGPWLDAFKEDMAVIALLRHPCILETLEIGTLPDGTPVVVTERPEGLTLGRWLASGRVAPTHPALDLLVEVADALGVAHDSGVSHGALGVDDIVLIPTTDSPLGAPKLRGFGHRWLRAAAAFDGAPTMLPGTRVVPALRREVATDVAALAAIADRLLTPLHRGPKLAAVLRSAQLLGDDLRFATPLALVEAIERALGERGPEEITAPQLVLPAQLRRRGARRIAATAVLTVMGAMAIHAVVAPRTRSVAARPAAAPARVIAAVPGVVPPSPAVSPPVAPPPSTPVRPAAAAVSVRGPAKPAWPRPPKLSRVWSARENKLIYVDGLGVPVPDPAPEN
jgi:hypothetical protein